MKYQKSLSDKASEAIKSLWSQNRNAKSESGAVKIFYQFTTKADVETFTTELLPPVNKGEISSENKMPKGEIRKS